MKNIVFIGLSGCGKTTVAKLAALELSRPWFDSDREIEADSEMSIPDIFKQYGEDYFRSLETQCLQKLLLKDGAVISAGGGAVLYNADLLKKNSVIVYIERGIEQIYASMTKNSRPLVNSIDDLKRLFAERSGIYESLRHFKVSNNGQIEQCVQAVLHGITALPDGVI